MKIGFIGLGNMGLPMARNLLQAGFEVYGKNRSRGKEEAFAAGGGKINLTIAEMARQLDVVITCLPLPEDVEKVYSGEEGLIQNAREGIILIDCSTVSPELNQRLFNASNEKGIRFLDAPISGGTTGAEAGTLSIMVGGEEDVFHSVGSVLEAMGKQIYYVGPSGCGSTVKLINQLMVGIHSQAVSEAFALGNSAGLDSDLLFNILNNSFAQSRIMERHYKQFISQENYEPGFALKLLSKDMNIVAEMASQQHVGLSTGNRVQALLQHALHNEFEELDMSGLYQYQLHRDGLAKQKRPLKHFAVFLPMKDSEKSMIHREAHLQFLEERRAEGYILANGRFVDGAGGLVIYRASSIEEVERLVQKDPYIMLGARDYDIHEWDIVLSDK
jgi:3-hydroxyisobutyrate dehydrogenase-like beta-hydroxyacid dehydrogenase/uncharacterized protein YciI